MMVGAGRRIDVCQRTQWAQLEIGLYKRGLFVPDYAAMGVIRPLPGRVVFCRAFLRNLLLAACCLPSPIVV